MLSQKAILDIETQLGQAERYRDIASRLMGCYSAAFPNYAWTDEESAVDLMAAEITTARLERDHLLGGLKKIAALKKPHPKNRDTHEAVRLAVEYLDFGTAISRFEPPSNHTPQPLSKTASNRSLTSMDNDSIINELQDFSAWIRRENRNRRTILKALDARVAYLQGVATQTVDVSGASATMQAGGVPCRGQYLPDATLVRSASDMQYILEKKTMEIEASGLCKWEYRESGPASMNGVLASVKECRALQDEQWGGPEHDDTHAAHEWLGFIQKQLDEADVALDPPPGGSNLDIYESRLIDVAALAVAAIQSNRRKRNA